MQETGICVENCYRWSELREELEQGIIGKETQGGIEGEVESIFYPPRRTRLSDRIVVSTKEWGSKFQALLAPLFLEEKQGLELIACLSVPASRLCLLLLLVLRGRWLFEDRGCCTEI